MSAAARPSLAPRAIRSGIVSTKGRLHGGELAAAISRTVVGTLSRTTGRGPMKAKTTLGDDGVFVVLEDTLTRGEHSLADAGSG